MYNITNQKIPPHDFNSLINIGYLYPFVKDITELIIFDRTVAPLQTRTSMKISELLIYLVQPKWYDLFDENKNHIGTPILTN